MATRTLHPQYQRSASEACRCGALWPVFSLRDLEPLPLLSSSTEDNLDHLKSSLLRGKLLDFAANRDPFRKLKSWHCGVDHDSCFSYSDTLEGFEVWTLDPKIEPTDGCQEQELEGTWQRPCPQQKQFWIGRAPPTLQLIARMELLSTHTTFP